jgi:hypothetical protein
MSLLRLSQECPASGFSRLAAQPLFRVDAIKDGLRLFARQMVG